MLWWMAKSSVWGRGLVGQLARGAAEGLGELSEGEGGLVELPCLPQPRTKSHRVATTQRHITSKRVGRKNNANWCMKHALLDPLSERERTAYPLFDLLSACI